MQQIAPNQTYEALPHAHKLGEKFYFLFHFYSQFIIRIASSVFIMFFIFIFIIIIIIIVIIVIIIIITVYIFNNNENSNNNNDVKTLLHFMR